MPVHRTRDGGYQWGEHGKVYHGPDAREKAARQGMAIKARQSAEKSTVVKKGRKR